MGGRGVASLTWLTWHLFDSIPGPLLPRLQTADCITTDFVLNASNRCISLVFVKNHLKATVDAIPDRPFFRKKRDRKILDLQHGGL